MSWLVRLLKKLRVLPHWSEDEFINASMDDALKDHEKAVQAMADAMNKRQESNARLRFSIHEARMRNAEFENFERAVRRIEEENSGAQ